MKPPYQNEVMELKELTPTEYYELCGYLEAVSDLIRTGELKWYFDIRLFEFGSPPNDITELITAVYSRAIPEEATISQCSVQELADTLHYYLFRDLKSMKRVGEFAVSFMLSTWKLWPYLKACIDYDQSRIYEYQTKNNSDEFGSGGISGDFAFVMLNEGQHRCLFLSGGDCD